MLTVIALLGIYPKNTRTLIQRATCTPMFTAALFTIAKLQKQPKCPLIDIWITKMWYIYIHNGILLRYKKKWIPAICKGEDGAREYYAK